MFKKKKKEKGFSHSVQIQGNVQVILSVASWWIFFIFFLCKIFFKYLQVFICLILKFNFKLKIFLWEWLNMEFVGSGVRVRVWYMANFKVWSVDISNQWVFKVNLWYLISIYTILIDCLLKRALCDPLCVMVGSIYCPCNLDRQKTENFFHYKSKNVRVMHISYSPDLYFTDQQHPSLWCAAPHDVLR